jgi:hypothetical protein
MLNFSKRFFISWLATSVVMFAISYIWHSMLLTDYSRLSYPKEIFLIAAAIVYLIIGFVVAKAIDIKALETRYKRKPLVRGLISGAACGFGFFLVATVVGISFSTGSKMENLLLDVSWQIIEQAIGGLTVGIVHYFVFDPSMIED